jgi:predicted SprT family Zn-dependent metalloprotease
MIYIGGFLLYNIFIGDNMIIKIHGAISKKARVESYVRRIMNHFQLLNKRTFIEIHIKTKLDGDAAGYCHGTRDHIIIELSRTCQGEKYRIDDILITLAHELIHAKQYIMGQLCPIHGNKWKGKTYTGYKNTPWEKEAYQFESELFYKYWVGEKHVSKNNCLPD